MLKGMLDCRDEVLRPERMGPLSMCANCVFWVERESRGGCTRRAIKSERVGKKENDTDSHDSVAAKWMKTDDLELRVFHCPTLQLTECLGRETLMPRMFRSQ